MMTKHYVEEKNVQVIIFLLKKRGIKKIVVSPGTTNVALVGSLQNDLFFEVYSSVDERSAAYLACGLAAESGEPVVLSCTGATASRNYLPGLTEAFYRKLPVLAITSTQMTAKVGHYVPQVIDNSILPNDVVKLSVCLPVVKDDDDLWECELKTNMALLELTRQGGGPVHINLPTAYSKSFNVKELSEFRFIRRVTQSDVFPNLPDGKIGIFIGAHAKMSQELENVIDEFCECNDAVVFCDHTSGYKGRFRILFSLVAGQDAFNYSSFVPELLIYIGEVSGDYYSFGLAKKGVWRVSEDGEVRDTFRTLRYVFEMSESSFFKHYQKSGSDKTTQYYDSCKRALNEFYKKVPELPFSNLWIASRLADQIPESSVIHFGILNSLRSWNFFELPKSVAAFSNVGGFGIDGGVSSLIGASFANKNKLYFGVFGDLAFFYDMNVLGNRHVGNNLRILLVNNGKGIEFRNYNHHAAMFGFEADKFIAAAGHFGNKSRMLVRHYAEDLGFQYLCATNKQEFENVYQRFISSQITDKPIIFEVFTNTEDESNALHTIKNISKSAGAALKQMAKNVIGTENASLIRKLLKK